jgi:hypothetical protein
VSANAGAAGPNVPLEGVTFDGLTLFESLARLEQAGYTGQFIARDGGVLECTTCRTRTHASEVVSECRLIRIEGVSDPADMMAVAALRCPSCGTRGTVVLSYGPEASAEDADILHCLDVPGSPEDAR